MAAVVQRGVEGGGVGYLALGDAGAEIVDPKGTGGQRAVGFGGRPAMCGAGMTVGVPDSMA